MQLQRVGGVHHALVVPWEVGQLHRLRAGGDDAVLKAQQLGLAVVADDFQLVGRDEAGHAGDGAHLALLGHAGQAAGELADHFFLVLAQLVQGDLGLAEVHAEVAGMGHFIDHRGGMQQRLDGMQPTLRQTPPRLA